MQTVEARYIVGVDPSGNFNEGKGHTGLAVYDIQEDKIDAIGCTYAGNYDTWMEYFKDTVYAIWAFCCAYKTYYVSIEDYILYAHKSKEQTNSQLETPRIIGYILMELWKRGAQVYMRPAVQAKTRWKEDVLVSYGYIEQRGKSYYWNDQLLLQHHMDAMKHAIQCGKFEVNKKNDKHRVW